MYATMAAALLTTLAVAVPTAMGKLNPRSAMLAYAASAAALAFWAAWLTHKAAA
jgi:hypothetical protein